MGYSPWGRKESDTTERLTHTFTLFTFHCYWIPLSLVHSLIPKVFLELLLCVQTVKVIISEMSVKER